MIFQKAHINDFERIKSFYWDLIDGMQDQNDVIGWKKGIYPTDEFLRESLLRVPSRFMRKFICRLRLSEVSRQ